MLRQVYPIMFNSSQPSAYDGLGDTCLLYTSDAADE